MLYIWFQEVLAENYFLILLQYFMEPALEHMSNLSCDVGGDLMLRSRKLVVSVIRLLMGACGEK